MTEEILYGINPVTETLRARRRKVHELLVVKGRVSERVDALRALARSSSVPVRQVDPRFMQERFDNREDQGVAARVSEYPYVTLEALLGSPRPALLVALDEIQDIGNLGAVARSAAALGAQGLIIHKDRSASITPAAVKASAGMVEHLPVARVTNLVRALEQARDAGIWIKGLDGAAPGSVYDEDLTVDTLIVMGSEDRGLRRLTRERCDALIGIPLDARCESLNVSTAAAIALAEAARQRRTRR